MVIVRWVLWGDYFKVGSVVWRTMLRRVGLNRI